ncbi:hypothetical protein LTR66_012051 [Elasticomyces elasticus]|nr:hypothetical protein LTR66_012051 [Elasticomyces elasticus]
MIAALDPASRRLAHTSWPAAAGGDIALLERLDLSSRPKVHSDRAIEPVASWNSNGSGAEVKRFKRYWGIYHRPTTSTVVSRSYRSLPPGPELPEGYQRGGECAAARQM